MNFDNEEEEALSLEPQVAQYLEHVYEQVKTPGQPGLSQDQYRRLIDEAKLTEWLHVDKSDYAEFLTGASTSTITFTDFLQLLSCFATAPLCSRIVATHRA